MKRVGAPSAPRISTFLIGLAQNSMVCSLAPLLDKIFITAEDRTAQRWLISIIRFVFHILVLALPAWSDSGVLVRTKLLAIFTGARSPLETSSLEKHN